VLLNFFSVNKIGENLDKFEIMNIENKEKTKFFVLSKYS